MAPIIDPVPLPAELPKLPIHSSQFIKHVNDNPQVPVRELVKPFREHENALRAFFARVPDHEFVKANTVNLVDVFADGNHGLKIERRDFEAGMQEQKDKYIIVLDEEKRKKTGEDCIVPTLKDFRYNFNIFSEGALTNLDWSNVIVAGSAALTPLLAVPEEYTGSKRALRQYYHEILAPASDIDLFLYGIQDETEAIAKLEAIETTVRDNLLWETTTIRTRNTITIVSQYPNRHIQIVLRLYKSIAQILHGFDVDCSAVAYDGTHVWTSPRALVACITQCNEIDLSRRSPSYENRLSKYSHRGFEIYCDFLDRSRIDPTIFERSFGRTTGLARLLVLEALPKQDQRDAYVCRRREETGRPQLDTISYGRSSKKDKKQDSDEIAEWDFEEISSYQKFSIPYGADYNARNIERRFFQKDLLLNADWNEKKKPPHRTVHLHRHPVFFGNVRDVVGDCCGYCPEPLNDEEKQVAEEEGKIYVKGPITFLSDDPGRQEIGSFHPLGPEDYTDMAYVGSSQVLCEAIVDDNVATVKSWCEQKGVDVNVRDFCGRTPLHLACMSTSTGLEVVQCLIYHGARLVARLQDGRTALHLAAARGRADIVAALLRRSAANEHKRDERMRFEKEKLKPPKDPAAVAEVDVGMKEAESGDAAESDGGYSHIDAESTDGGAASTTTSGFVKFKGPLENALAAQMLGEAEEELADDIYDINIAEWDYSMSPLHFAILAGHNSVIETLVSDFGADVRAPIMQRDSIGWGPSALLNLVLALNLPEEKRRETIATLLKLGASSAQATNNRDESRTSALHYFVNGGAKDALETVFDHDQPGALSVLNNAQCDTSDYHFGGNAVTPLIAAMYLDNGALELTKYLLGRGANVQITTNDLVRNMKPTRRKDLSAADLAHKLRAEVQQPLEHAIVREMAVDMVALLLEHGANPNILCKQDLHWPDKGAKLPPANAQTLLDMVRCKIEMYLAAIKETELAANAHANPEPATPGLDDSVLNLYLQGSYQRFTAGRYLDQLRRNKKAISTSHPPHKYVTRKHEACKEKLEELKKVEKLLMDAGAKPMLDLYPELLEHLKSHPQRDRVIFHSMFGAAVGTTTTEPKETKFEPFTVKHPYLGEGDVHGGYLRLFEATWNGRLEDMETVRMLTSGPSGEGEDRVPALQVSVADSNGFTALFIALYKGNFDMADLIMEIVKDQYEEIKTPAARAGMDNDSDDSHEEEVMEILKDATVEDSGAEQNLVKCNTSPYAYVQSSTVDARHLLTTEECQEYLDAAWYSQSQYLDAYQFLNWSPLTWAIYKNSIPLVRRILSLIRTAAINSACPDADMAVDSFFHCPGEFTNGMSMRTHLRVALVLNRTSILTELMKTLTFGFPYLELAEVDAEYQKSVNPNYRGLTIRGAKKADWVRDANPNPAISPSDRFQKPAHVAAYHGALESLLWLQSQQPWEALKYFISNNPTSNKVRFLEQHDTVTLFQRGLGLTTNQLPHLCIKGWRATTIRQARAEAMLTYLLSRPSAATARTPAGLTPALFAVQQRNLPAIQYLVKEGADFSARDTTARNVLHLLLGNYNVQQFQDLLHVEEPLPCPSLPKSDLASFLSSLPTGVVTAAWSQRQHGTLTPPLAAWIADHARSSIHLPAFRFLLSVSGGVGLAEANSEGNSAIHELTRGGQVSAIEILLESFPEAELASRENGNGRTAGEIAEAAWRRDKVGGAFPDISGDMQEGKYWRPVYERSPLGFSDNVKEEERDVGKVSVDDTWRLLKEVAGAEKRRLCKLETAEEVARRVAKKQMGVVELLTQWQGDMTELW